MEWRPEDNKIGLKLGWRSKRKGEERRGGSEKEREEEEGGGKEGEGEKREEGEQK